MKNVLKALSLVVVGAIAGAAITGFLLNRFSRVRESKLYAMNAASNVLLAHQLKDGNADIILSSAEQSIVRDVLYVSGNVDLKDALIADTVLNGAKRFYVCTKTEIPPEIAAIMDAQRPVDTADCSAG